MEYEHGSWFRVLTGAILLQVGYTLMGYHWPTWEEYPGGLFYVGVLLGFVGSAQFGFELFHIGYWMGYRHNDELHAARERRPRGSAPSG